MRRHAVRRSPRGKIRSKQGSGNWLWKLLIIASITAFAGIGYLWWSLGEHHRSDATTNCPPTGPVGAIAFLFDASSSLSRAQESRLRNEINHMLFEAPTGTMISIGMVSDREADQGARLALCKPLSGDQVSATTANPTMISARFRQNFLEPIEAELVELMGLSERGASARVRQQRDLEASLADTGASVVNTGSELVITLPEQITFSSGSITLREDLTIYLSAIARNLALRPEMSVQIIGHTDNIGALSLNQELSERRAAAVAEVFLNENIEPGRVQILGRGFLEPIAVNDTEAGRRQNRRVELVLATRAPIMESLQALIAETPLLVDDGMRREIHGERRVVIVSDLLQNSEVVSFYRGQEWADFERSRDFNRLGRNLHQVRVELLHLPRDEPAIRDRDAVGHFWQRYFDYQGAQSLEIRRMGDL